MILLALVVSLAAAAESPSIPDLLKTAVAQLVSMQEDDGAWPYEGVYRVRGDIPLGYRVGGTAIVVDALRRAAPDDADVRKAAERGIAYILDHLDDPLLAPSTRDAYDVRVWGHCYALELFCRVRGQKYAGPRRDEIEKWIPRLVATLLEEELPGGGWNYANRRAHAGFVTAPVVQTLLLARSQGERVSDKVFEQARDVLRASRYETGAFLYSGLRRESPSSAPASAPTLAGGESDKPASRPSDAGAGRAALPGSIARSAICETTLALLGDGSAERIKRAIDAFHTHWDELEKRRRKTGTHEGPYGIAPYYFYYGHRYAAQAIEFLPESKRAAERKRLLDVILRTRDEDGTWNDRVFPRSRNFGTAMIVLALLGERQPLPPALDRKP